MCLLVVASLSFLSLDVVLLLYESDEGSATASLEELTWVVSLC